MYLFLQPWWKCFMTLALLYNSGAGLNYIYLDQYYIFWPNLTRHWSVFLSLSWPFLKDIFFTQKPSHYKNVLLHILLVILKHLSLCCSLYFCWLSSLTETKPNKVYQCLPSILANFDSLVSGPRSNQSLHFSHYYIMMF